VQRKVAKLEAWRGRLRHGFLIRRGPERQHCSRQDLENSIKKIEGFYKDFIRPTWYNPTPNGQPRLRHWTVNLGWKERGINMNATSKIGAVLFAAVLVWIGTLGAGRAGIQSQANAAARQDENRDMRECSLKTVQGSFGISTTGWIVAAGPIGPVADVGVITFDGAGGVSQTTTVSLNGVIIPKRTSLNGSYEVNSDDCTGSITLTLPTPTGTTISKSNFVIVNHGQELRTIVTGEGRVLAGTANRQ
jgi:hypothetical protein